MLTIFGYIHFFCFYKYTVTEYKHDRNYKAKNSLNTLPATVICPASTYYSNLSIWLAFHPDI